MCIRNMRVGVRSWEKWPSHTVGKEADRAEVLSAVPAAATKLRDDHLAPDLERNGTM